MKKIEIFICKTAKELAKKSLFIGANTTSSILSFEPTQPPKLKSYKKTYENK